MQLLYLLSFRPTSASFALYLPLYLFFVILVQMQVISIAHSHEHVISLVRLTLNLLVVILHILVLYKCYVLLLSIYFRLFLDHFLFLSCLFAALNKS